jgi:hypothetical protein
MKFAVVVAVLAVAYLGYIKWTYPYGPSHCCIGGLGTALRIYALEHSGQFPTGGDTPEGSLSLLYSNYVDAYTLRGKTVPLKVTEVALRQNGKLGPDSCGWHYVDGLTESDNPQIAIVWDKVGLGHNGERIKGGGHEILFLDGSHRVISASKWPEFLDEQRQLLAQRLAAVNH